MRNYERKEINIKKITVRFDERLKYFLIFVGIIHNIAILQIGKY